MIAAIAREAMYGSPASMAEQMPQVGEPDCGRVGQVVGAGVAEGVKGGADGGPRKVRQQAVNRGYLVTIAQCL